MSDSDPIVVRLRIVSGTRSLQELMSATGIEPEDSSSFSLKDPVPKWLQKLEGAEKREISRIQLSREFKSRKAAEGAILKMLRTYEGNLISARDILGATCDIQVVIESYERKPCYLRLSPELVALCSQMRAEVLFVSS